MIITRPSPPAPGRIPSPPRTADQSWQLLAAGDEVTIGGSGAYEIIHVSDGRAWVSALDDGSSRLIDAAAVRLVCSAGTRVVGRA